MSPDLSASGSRTGRSGLGLTPAIPLLGNLWKGKTVTVTMRAHHFVSSLPFRSAIRSGWQWAENPEIVLRMVGMIHQAEGGTHFASSKTVHGSKVGDQCARERRAPYSGGHAL
jgi:hypothetical protein